MMMMMGIFPFALLKASTSKLLNASTSKFFYLEFKLFATSMFIFSFELMKRIDFYIFLRLQQISV